MNYATTSGMANPLTPAAEDQRFSALTPKRVQLSRAKGWRMPANTVSVARPGPWGNDWVVWRDGGVWMVTARGCMHYEFESRETAQAFAVLKHRVAMERSAGFYGGATLLAQLAGKNLACWCKPGTPCHADTLLRLANPEVTHG